MTTTTTLAKAGAADIIMWVAILAALMIAGGMVIMLLRRRLFTQETGGDETLMQSLRRMRDTGEMSQEEFEATRKSLIAKVKAKPRANDAKAPLDPDEERDRLRAKLANRKPPTAE